VSRRGYLAAAAGAVSLLLLAAPAANADQTPPGGPSLGTTATTDDQTVSVKAGGVSYDTSKNGKGTSVGPLTSVDSNWSPPPCWYTPTWSPQQFKDYVEQIWAVDSTGYEWDAKQRDRYVNGHPYTNFNLDKTGRGYWWTSYVPEGGAGVPGALDCTAPYFWVDKGEPAPADLKNALTPAVLAQLAYAQIKVPDTDVNLNPSLLQRVNIPTWAWLDTGTFHTYSVTATADLLGISATATATPVALHLDPGTDYADVHPASGDCPLNADGTIGTPYVKGSGLKPPPCGVVYRKSTPGTTTYPLRATVTWKVTWTGTNGTGGDLPNGTFGHTTYVTVKEVQSVNR
jgi:enoyl reductase